MSVPMSKIVFPSTWEIKEDGLYRKGELFDGSFSSKQNPLVFVGHNDTFYILQDSCLYHVIANGITVHRLVAGGSNE